MAETMDRMSYWASQVQEHKRHPTFRTHTWAHTREYGFTCACSGEEQEWRLNVIDLKSMVPAALASVRRLFGFGPKPGDRARKKARELAEVKAKALFFRYLSSEQKWELKATKAITVHGADGRVYLVTEGTCNNVFVTIDGVRYSCCVIPKNDSIPVYDLMLAQKVMLENDPESFLRTAIVMNQETRKTFESGGFLVEGGPEPSKLRTTVLTIQDEDLDQPLAWTEEQTRA